MTPYEELLRLIETVDPKDHEKLEELNAKVWCFLNEKEFVGRVGLHKFYYKGADRNYVCGDDTYYGLPEVPNYSTSRDALKSIRPNGWYFTTSPVEYRSQEAGFFCRANFYRTHFDENGEDTFSRWLPTEELAELYAIIQAIQHDRENGK